MNSLATATSSITGLERIEFPVSSAEDTNLARLDREYLNLWATDLGVADLLTRLIP